MYEILKLSFSLTTLIFDWYLITFRISCTMLIFPIYGVHFQVKPITLEALACLESAFNFALGRGVV